MSPSRYDEDSDDERLPEGMTRVGYDADTQIYTFQDADGSYWEGAAGCRYGRLTRVGQAAGDADDSASASASAPFLAGPTDHDHRLDGKPSWRRDMMPFLNFGLLAGLSLMVLFWFLYRGPAQEEEKAGDVFVCSGPSVVVEKGDTCWEVAEKRGSSVEQLESLNPWLDCERLPVGSILCLPE